MALVNPPPQKIPEALRKESPELFAYLEEMQFFQYQLWKRTGGGGDIILQTTNEITNITNDIQNITNSTTAASTSGQLYAHIFKLQKRVEELESNDITSALLQSTKLAHKRIDELIEELLEELKLQRPDLEVEREKLSIIRQQLKETKLLNARVEEAFETTIDEGDL